jgi:hypothetical protein
MKNQRNANAYSEAAVFDLIDELTRSQAALRVANLDNTRLQNQVVQLQNGGPNPQIGAQLLQCEAQILHLKATQEAQQRQLMQMTANSVAQGRDMDKMLRDIRLIRRNVRDGGVPRGGAAGGGHQGGAGGGGPQGGAGGGGPQGGGCGGPQGGGGGVRDRGRGRGAQ